MEIQLWWSSTGNLIYKLIFVVLSSALHESFRLTIEFGKYSYMEWESVGVKMGLSCFWPTECNDMRAGFYQLNISCFLSVESLEVDENFSTHQSFLSSFCPPSFIFNTWAWEVCFQHWDVFLDTLPSISWFKLPVSLSVSKWCFSDFDEYQG